jgi:hypothetical protein
MYASTEKFQFFSIQASGILMEPSNISNKMYHLIKSLQKQNCKMHISTQIIVALLATTSNAAVDLLHIGA